MKKEYLFVFIALIVAFIVRFWGLQTASLRLDETQSVWQATHSVGFITEYMLKNVHLPLHNSLLHVWMQIFGTSPTSVRMLALIPGIIVIPVLYYLSIEIIGRKSSLYTLFLAALSPIWVWYSKEIRMYTLLVLVTTLSYYFFVKALKENKLNHLIFYTLINILGIYTHYFFALVLGVQILYYMIMFKKFKPENGFAEISHLRRFANLFAVAVIVLMSFYPWLKAMYTSHGSDTYAPVLGHPTPFNIILTYFEFISGFIPDVYGAIALSLWPLFILLGFIFLTKRQNPFSQTFLLVVLGAVMPITVGYIVSIFIRPVYLSRYFITVTPMLYILVAWYLAELKGWVKYVIASFVFGWMIFSLYTQSTHPHNPALENYAEAIDFIEEKTTFRDVVLLAPAYTIYPFQYYYNGSAKVSTMPIWDKRKGAIPYPTEERLVNDTQSLREGHQKFYLLLTDNLEQTDEVKQFLDMNYTKLDKRQFSKHIWVHVYQAEYR